MSRYIDAYETYNIIQKRLFQSSYNNIGIEARVSEVYDDISNNRLYQWIADVPTADVRPVVRGEWKEDGEGEIYCSKCGRYTYDRHDEIIKFNGATIIALCYPRYCGNCGAEMVKGEEDESI